MTLRNYIEENLEGEKISNSEYEEFLNMIKNKEYSVDDDYFKLYISKNNMFLKLSVLHQENSITLYL